jgi:hypothetical protein
MKNLLVVGMFTMAMLGAVAQRTETRPLKTFQHISIQDRIVVILVDDTLNQVVLKPEADAWIEEVKTSVSGKELDIHADGRFRDSRIFCYVHHAQAITRLTTRYGGIYRTDSLQVYHTPKLELDAKIDGFANLNIDVEELVISAGSGSDIYIRGKAQKVVVNATSGAKIHLEDLECEDAEVNSSMGAKVWLTAKNNYKATAGTGGKIYYYAEPAGNFERNRITGGNVELITR